MFEPVEVLDVSPQVLLTSSLALLDISIDSIVSVVVLFEGHTGGVLDYPLAGGEDTESCVCCVVDSELVATDLDLTVRAVVDEHSGLGGTCENSAVFEVFEEEDVSHSVEVDCAVLCVDDLERTSKFVMGDCDYLVGNVGYTRH